MDEISLLEIRIAYLESELGESIERIENLNLALEQTLSIILNNINAISIISRLLQQQNQARIDWLN